MPVRLTDLSLTVLETQYAVRGPIVARAAELEKRGEARSSTATSATPRPSGQKPLTYIRQTLALCEYPALLDGRRRGRDAALPRRRRGGGADRARGHRVRPRRLLRVQGRQGHPRGRRRASSPSATASRPIPSPSSSATARARASSSPCASSSRAPTDGIMVPIPQYPLYSATITLYGGRRSPTSSTRTATGASRASSSTRPSSTRCARASRSRPSASSTPATPRARSSTTRTSR